MGQIFSKCFGRSRKIDSNKLAQEFWSKKQEEARAILMEQENLNKEHELQKLPPQDILQQQQSTIFEEEQQEKQQKDQQNEPFLQLDQQEQTQLIQFQQQQQPQQSQQIQLQQQQENVESIKEQQQQEMSDQKLQSDLQQKSQTNMEINLKEEQQQFFEQQNPEVEHKWLSRIFGIDYKTKEVMKKKIKSFPSVKLSVDFMCEKMLHSILTSNEFSELEKFCWLSDKVSQLAQAEIENQYVTFDEGMISLSSFEKIMDHILNYLIQGVVHPERLKWKIELENINNFQDISNQRASFIFDFIFVRSFTIFSFGDKLLTFLLHYLDTKANIHDAHSFMDYMFKREFKSLLVSMHTEYERPIMTLKFLQTVVNYPRLTASLLMSSWAFGRFDQIQTGKQFSQNCIVGQILSISGFIVQGRNLMELLARLKQNNTTINNAKRSFLIIDEFTILFKLILRKGSNDELFKYLSKIIELNLNLEKLKNELLFWQCSPAGMIFNLQQILLAIINPWINQEEKLNKSLQNVDLKLIASLKKHPFLKSLYQSMPQIAPETTPYQIDQGQLLQQDKMTMIFLLTQRVNHIVATYIDQIYIGEILNVLYITKEQFGIDSDHYCLFLKLKIDFDSTYLDQVSMQNTMQFLSFSSQLAKRLLDKDSKPIYPYGLLAESFLKDIHTFVTIYNENLDSLNLEQEVLACCEFIVLTLNHRNLVANPHQRIKGIEFFNLLDQSASTRKSGVKKALASQTFALNQNIQNNLIPGWLKGFSDSEIAGFGIQFFDKFNIRYKFCKFLRFILEKHFEIFKERIKQTFIQEKEQFMICFDFYLNDLCYILDECLKKLKIAKQIEDEFVSGQQERQLQYSQNERELNEQVTFLTEYYDTLQVLSQVFPDAFLTEELRDRLVNFLNFTLYSFNGPQAKTLLCQSMKAINFDHRRIIVYVIGLYINLSKNDLFLQQVVKDDRYFSIEVLQNAINNLDNQILPKQRAQKFLQQIEKLIVLKEEEEQLNQIMTDVPDEFIDPLVTTLMTDPVKLPNSKMIVDRVTIKKQLLNSNQDPFDRSYLTIEMIIEQPQLKQKIAEYLKEKKQLTKNKQKINQQQ